MIDTGLFVKLLESVEGDAPSRLETWVKDAVEQAGCDFEGHSIGLATSNDLLKEYRFRLGRTFGKPFYLGLDDYLDKFDGFRSKLMASSQNFLFGPTRFSPPPVSRLRMSDRFDNKLCNLVAYLLGRYADRAVLFGSADRDASEDIETMRTRRLLPRATRLKIARSPGELEDLIADH